MLVNIHNIHSTFPSITFKTAKNLPNLPVSGSEFLEKSHCLYQSSFQATVDSDILSKLIVRTGAGYILRVRSRFKRNPPLVEREGESFNFQELHHQNYQNA